MTIPSGRPKNVATRYSIGARVSTVVIGLALVSALTSCRTGASLSPSDAGAMPSGTSAETPTASPSPTADPSPVVPTAVASPTPSHASGGSLTIITLEVLDGVVQASGIVPGTVADGECTLTLTRAGMVRSATVPAAMGRDSTYCGIVSVPVNTLDSGEWDAVLSFASSMFAAQSVPHSVQVP